VLQTGDLQVDDLTVEVTVRRVKRMNVRVHPPDGRVRLSVPPRTSERAIVRFVRELRLEVEGSGSRPAAEVLPGDRLVVRVPAPDDAAAVLAVLDRWQRSDLRTVAEPLLQEWCSRLGVRHDFLGLRRMTTRWGTCVPARRRIWLNVALITRPVPLIEYVVVHEVVHLREPSHGPAFRALMDTHLPDWRARRAFLDASV